MSDWEVTFKMDFDLEGEKGKCGKQSIKIGKLPKDILEECCVEACDLEMQRPVKKKPYRLESMHPEWNSKGGVPARRKKPRKKRISSKYSKTETIGLDNPPTTLSNSITTGITGTSSSKTPW